MSKFKPPRQVNTRGDLIRFQKELNHYRWEEGLGSLKVRIDGEFSRSEHQLWLKLQRKGYKVNENGNLYNPKEETRELNRRRREESPTRKEVDKNINNPQEREVVVPKKIEAPAPVQTIKEKPPYWGPLLKYIFGIE